MPVRYDRIIPNCDSQATEKIRQLIEKITQIKPTCANPEYAFDLHIREKSKVMMYHGGTCLLTINLSKISAGKISFFSPSYGQSGVQKRSRGCVETFAALRVETTLDDVSAVVARVAAFVQEAIATVADKFYTPESEGYWSNKLSIDYGRNWTPDKEWLIIDREAVIGFDTTKSKDDFYTAKKNEFNKYKQDVLSQHAWSKGSKSFGDELDFLAIGRDQQLVCIELKHGYNASGIYWGPLQTAMYQSTFHEKVAELSESIKKMVRQRVALGLLPEEAEQWLPKDEFKRVEGVLAVADADKYMNSRCWQRANIVNKRLPKPVVMLGSRDTDTGLKWEPFPQ